MVVIQGASRMRNLTILFALLFVMMLGLYLYERQQRLAMTEAVQAAQDAAEVATDRYEEQLARLRFELEQRGRPRQGLESMQALRDVQETLRHQRLREHHQTLREASITLGLEEERSQALANALRRFDAGKRQLVTQTRAEGAFLSDHHLDLVDELRQETLTLLAEIFSSTEYEQFFQQGFAERLDLVSTSDSAQPVPE